MDSSKSFLYGQSLIILEQLLATYKQAIANARIAQQNETKSSAGDKYETNREMMTQEIENATRQLLVAESEMRLLQNAFLNNIANGLVHHGSIVKTQTDHFYIAASVGRLVLKAETYHVVSPLSPIGKLLIGKAVGDIVTLHTKNYSISHIL